MPGQLAASAAELQSPPTVWLFVHKVSDLSEGQSPSAERRAGGLEGPMA